MNDPSCSSPTINLPHQAALSVDAEEMFGMSQLDWNNKVDDAVVRIMRGQGMQTLGIVYMNRKGELDPKNEYAPMFRMASLSYLTSHEEGKPSKFYFTMQTILNGRLLKALLNGEPIPQSHSEDSIQ